MKMTLALLVIFCLWVPIAKAETSLQIGWAPQPFGGMPIHDPIQLWGTEYQVFPKLKNARLHITFASYDYQNEMNTSPYAVDDFQVPGLIFNSSTQDVSFTPRGRNRIICGRTSIAHDWLGGQSIKVTPTGACWITLRNMTVTNEFGVESQYPGVFFHTR